MNKIVLLNLTLAFFFLTWTTQAQQSGMIYERVLELQKEFPKESIKIYTQNSTLQIPSHASAHISKAEYFEIDNSFVSKTKAERPEVLQIELPFEGEKLHALLYKKDITSTTYKVKAASGAQNEITTSIFYRGILKGESTSLVSLSMMSNGMHMTISDGNGNIEVNKINESLYAAYRISDSKHTQETSCSTTNSFLNTQIDKNTNSGERSGECIEVYIECDFDSYTKNGSSVQNTEDWALAIMNEVGILYDNAGITMFVSDILVYDQPDPYLAGNNSGQVLGLMGNVIGNNYDGRLAHVFSTRGLGGGVAYVNVLCATNNGGSFGPYAVSGSMNSNVVPFPIYSWNVMVVAHELGHNVGSLHTHDCVWNGNNTQIDDCGNQATSQGDNAVCYDENNPILPNGGSIMSYCHLIGNIGIDFNIGFHPQVASLLFDRYISASCVTGEECGISNPPIADFSFNQSEICNPTEVQFTDLSQNDPTSHIWVFQGGNPSISTDPNPVVLYSEPGVYDVSLTVSNFAGEDDLYLFQAIQVIETPIPDFDSKLENGVLKFTNQTTGLLDITFWDFGDGNFSAEENPCHTYEEDGSYIVTLSVENICGSFQIEKYIDFFTAPTASFEADSTLGCSIYTVNFMNKSSANSEDFLWLFEGGEPMTSSIENPTVEYDSAGVYDVILIVSNEQGEDTLEMTEYINVNSFPIAEFEYAVDSVEITFTNQSENYDSIAWDFGDGNTSTLINPIHTYAEEGTYDITLMASNICDTLTIIKTIQLSSLPTANYSTNLSEGCLPLSVEFLNTSSANSDTWEWNFPGGTPSSSTEENPVVTYSEIGNYDVTLIVTNESGPDTMNTINLISVSDIPTANFDFSVTDLEVIFTDSSIGYDSIQWDFGDGHTSTQINPIHIYEEDGLYEVLLTTTNKCGSNTSIQTILVSTLPIAGFSSSTMNECVPFTIEYLNSSSSNSDVVEWKFQGGSPSSSTEENPIISYETAGIFDVSLIVSSLSGNDTLIMEGYITSQDVPNANFEFVALSEFEISFTNLSVNGDNYFWDFGDGTNSTEENPIHLYEEAGVYTVLLSTNNSCGEETHEQVITISEPTSTNEIEVFNDLYVFPNPNRGEFTLSMHSNISGQIDIELYNTLGQSVFSDNVRIAHGLNTRNIHLNESAPGIYFLVIQNKNDRQILKIFLE